MVDVAPDDWCGRYQGMGCHWAPECRLNVAVPRSMHERSLRIMQRDFPIVTGPTKPAQGQPCNGCGSCCQTAVCSLGKWLFGWTPAPCPALRWHAGRSWCGVVEMEADFVAQGRLPAPDIAVALGVDRGCDTDDEGRREGWYGSSHSGGYPWHRRAQPARPRCRPWHAGHALDGAPGGSRPCKGTLSLMS